MRDYYRKKLRELEKIKAGHLDKKFKKWSLYDKLDFLKPFLRHIELDCSSTPANCRNDSRIDSDVDSEEEGVHLGIVKAELSEEDEDDNQSDDSYRREVVQALDAGHGSLDLSRGKTSSKTTSSQSRFQTIRRRAAYLDADVPVPKQACKRQRSEWNPPASTIKPVKLTPEVQSGAEDSPVVINPNQHFFASLIPMIETLDPLTAMEFRHDVHGILLRYLKQEREKKVAALAKSSNSVATSSEPSQHDNRSHAVADESVMNVKVRNDCENGTS